jgi:hypothetical protein
MTLIITMKSTILAFTLDRMMLTGIVFRKGEADCEHIMVRHEWVEKIALDSTALAVVHFHASTDSLAIYVIWYYISFIDSSSLNPSVGSEFYFIPTLSFLIYWDYKYIFWKHH